MAADKPTYQSSDGGQAIQGRRWRHREGREAGARGRARSVLAPVALVVDGAKVTTDAKELANVAVTGEVSRTPRARRSASTSSKNKTGLHTAPATVSHEGRQGHRTSRSEGANQCTQEGRFQLRQWSRLQRSGLASSDAAGGRQGPRDHVRQRGTNFHPASKSAWRRRHPASPPTHGAVEFGVKRGRKRSNSQTVRPRVDVAAGAAPEA